VSAAPQLDAHAVLMVDDEAQACKWFARRYGGEFTVLTAGGMDEALKVLAERGPEVAVLMTDYRMPRHTGVDLLAAASASHPHVVRVLMSAYADKEVAMQAVNLGRVEHILEKPLDEALTRQVLRDALATARQRTQERALGERRAAMLRETLGFLAHEVRTPLATVSGYLAALRDRAASGAVPGPAAPDAAPGDTLRMIEAAQRRAEYAQSLVTSFVNTAREAYRPDSPQTVTAGDLVRAAQHEYPFEPGERERLHTALDADFPVPGRQRDLLYLVLCTLIKNALQAQQGQTEPAPRIALVLGRSPGPSLSVIDNGPGLPAALKDRLSRQPVASGSGGTGMGLLFCRRVMTSMGGDMALGDTEGGGATVTLLFPETRTVEDPP